MWEYRVIAKDGRALWFHDVATLVTDDEGRNYQGIQFEITEREAADEEALRAQQPSWGRAHSHSIVPGGFEVMS